MKYFTYGSNMDQNDLNNWCDKKGYPRIIISNPKVAELKNYKLDFNYYSSGRGGGAANIIEVEGESVFGLVYDLNDTDYKHICIKEGAPNFYKEIDVIVFVSGENLSVKTFKVVKEREKPTFQVPKRDYRDLILNAAIKYKFPDEYVKMIRCFDVKE